MTTDELKKEAEEWLCNNLHSANEEDFIKAMVDIAEPREKRIAELEQKISVLLSCKNCPENKGGFICQKEYEDKCLAQKIQYIRELKEENENLKKTYRKQRNKRIDDLQKENAELRKLKRECETSLCRAEYQYNYEQLTKAKELLEKWYKQHSDKGYTETFYQNLLRETENLLWSEAEK